MARSKFTTQLADEICRRMTEGESLRSICAGDDMPATSAVMRWVSEKPDFQEQYARAMEARADAIFDEMFDIADDGQNDWMERNGEDNEGWSVNGEHVQRSKLRIDARKWALARMSPKKYGDKITNAHEGNLGVDVKISFAD